MEEQWKLITCLKDQAFTREQYEASNLGRIRMKRNQRVIKPHLHNSGYYSFHYSWTDILGYRHFSVELWHRVIAKTWIPNPDNLPQIDHINRDKRDNAIDNLRWVDNHGNQLNTGRRGKKLFNRHNPVYKIDGDYNIIETYDNAIICAEIEQTSIKQINNFCCGTRLPKRGGITFTQQSYIEDRGMKLIEDENGLRIVKI